MSEDTARQFAHACRQAEKIESTASTVEPRN